MAPSSSPPSSPSSTLSPSYNQRTPSPLVTGAQLSSEEMTSYARFGESLGKKGKMEVGWREDKAPSHLSFLILFAFEGLRHLAVVSYGSSGVRVGSVRHEEFQLSTEGLGLSSWGLREREALREEGRIEEVSAAWKRERGKETTRQG